MMSKLRIGALYALALIVIVGAGWGIAQAVDPRITASDIQGMREAAAVQAGREFLDEYVEDDGRVVRRDEGGDVVSEGQAYGMLIAVAVGDEACFRKIWDWTKTHLSRPDGLLSWRWADGAVTDANSAADADLDVARSLLLAGNRFEDNGLAEDGKQLGRHILDAESIPVGGRTAPSEQVVVPGRMVVAGNWATAPPFSVNPGYFSPRAELELFQVSADQRWREISRSQRVLSWQLIGGGALPPDWAVVDEAGHAVPMPAPGGGPVHFGLDAARVPIRFAESCDPADREVAAGMRTVVAAPGDVPGLRNLDGTPAGDWQHPVALVAAAAADDAAGDDDAAATRLDEATALQRQYPTYFGSAWVALGRIMLATSLLGECPQNGGRFLHRDP
ncbi:glycoside hydrolase [Mycobacterium barrassiae]|nr:glycoside hydrolase [Mycobacterium barrassiae]